MSKRGESKTTGHGRDLVDTPPEPVAKLVPHLDGLTTFSEPCAGAAVLIGHLSAHGLRCGEAYDIAPRHPSVEQGDALTRAPVHTVISNPPYSRGAIMPILTTAATWPHPSWWLVPWDTLANVYFSPVRPHVDRILSVGRVSWVRNTDGSATGPGFENYGWVRLGKESFKWLSVTQ